MLQIDKHPRGVCVPVVLLLLLGGSGGPKLDINNTIKLPGFSFFRLWETTFLARIPLLFSYLYARMLARMDDYVQYL